MRKSDCNTQFVCYLRISSSSRCLTVSQFPHVHANSEPSYIMNMNYCPNCFFEWHLVVWMPKTKQPIYISKQQYWRSEDLFKHLT